MFLHVTNCFLVGSDLCQHQAHLQDVLYNSRQTFVTFLLPSMSNRVSSSILIFIYLFTCVFVLKGSLSIHFLLSGQIFSSARSQRSYFTSDETRSAAPSRWNRSGWAQDYVSANNRKAFGRLLSRGEIFCAVCMWLLCVWSFKYSGITLSNGCWCSEGTLSVDGRKGVWGSPESLRVCARIPEVELLDIDYTLFSKGHNFHFVKCGLGIKDMKKEEEGGWRRERFQLFFFFRNAYYWCCYWSLYSFDLMPIQRTRATPSSLMSPYKVKFPL